jgi:hypothetical protein
MTVMLDIMSSIVIGGFIILMSFGILDSTNKFLYSHNDDLIVQQNLTAITSTLEYDLKKIGFGIPEHEQIILLADTTHMRMRGDINRDWKADTIEYFVGPPSELAHTQNPDDRILYRKINGLPNTGGRIGIVTDFRFAYLDQDRNVVDISNPVNWQKIKLIRTTLMVENPAAYTDKSNPDPDEYRTAFWQETDLVSRNLRR